MADVRRGGGCAGKASGFTLVEVVISLSLLVVVMAGVYRSLESAFRLRRASHQHYLAVVIANNRIERAKNVAFDDLGLLDEERLPVTAQGVPEPDGLFRRTTVVEPDFDGNTSLARVTVTVEVPPARHRRHRRVPVSETVSTLLTDYGDS